ncbi:alginate export family protein [Microbulbifer sp. CAU 1566]|uniref:alginate export family protein n=1 Tax=Microbulbifer sp. CAU 1566 TaxID=2933269 RepID=UPI0020055E2D|nr:alginate export family protein [Microbulbifer sp. CAU 1566]MCK7596133.1 alginate export family protein [Microbulbifer sp. CAU 1566]
MPERIRRAQCSTRHTAIATLVLTLAPTFAVQAEENIAQNAGDMIRNSTFNLNFRPRYEHVRDVAFPHHATAGTLRSRATWTSARWDGWEFLIEGDNVTYISSENFNNTENGKTNYPVIADPDYSEINRGQLSYAREQGLITVGRQRINFDDQRFIGGVAWRQNEQTYDALRTEWAFSETFSVDYFYSWNVNRIFGPDGADADIQGPVNALDLHFKINPNHKLTGFIYSLDFHDQEQFASATFGFDWAADFECYRWHLRAATQNDIGGNPIDYTAEYYNAEIGSKPLQKYKFAGHVGTEWLTGDGEWAFQTPLATLHKFQGYDDKFLTTPADGIRDYYVGGSVVVSGIKIAATLHKFYSDRDSREYGNELDLVATYAITKNIGLLAKYATYDADTFSSDTDKFWLQFELKF